MAYRVVVADENGQMWDARGWTPAVRSGVEVRPARTEDWIEAPPGTILQRLPGRAPLGWPRGASLNEAPVRLEGGLAVAAQLPSGYTRTLLPAYQRFEGGPFLPFFGYTAVAFLKGKPWVAAVQTDDNPHWRPSHYGSADLEGAISRRRAASPDNRVLQQLEICARDYGCYNAQNVFLGRWEGAVPVSPACNAVCVGCISEQPEDKPPSPQQRFRFVPTVEEIVEVGAAHLTSEESIYSFGQGCEGEPLLQGKRIAEAVAELRRRTTVGTLHLNTNGSRPEAFQKVVEAGLDSVRVSLNSVLAPVYTAYYQPRDYAFSALEECIGIARSHGVLVSLNYLHMPGWNDREEEVEALCGFVQRLDVQMIQMRTLNIDPDLYAQTVPFPGGAPVGIGELIRRVCEARPALKIGNHTLPKSRWNRQGLTRG